jgi:hypothetical protein
MAALDLVKMGDVSLAGGLIDPMAPDDQPRVVEDELDLVAGHPRQFGGDDVAVARLVDVDRRGPGVRLRRGQALLPGSQIAHRVPRHMVDLTGSIDD